MSTLWSNAVVIALVAAATTSCEEPPLPMFDAVIRVESDPDIPLAGAILSHDQKEVATTDAAGRAKLTIRGNEGSAFDYFVRCPTDFESPNKPVTVILRSVVDKNKPPEYPVSCPPTIRKVVIAVRADGGPNLPVTYLDQKIATTDASGSATILLNMRPGDQFELRLDTSGDANARMRPQTPVFPFSVKAKDEVLNLNAKFQLAKGKIFVGKAKVFPHEIKNRDKESGQ